MLHMKVRSAPSIDLPAAMNSRCGCGGFALWKKWENVKKTRVFRQFRAKNRRFSGVFDRISAVSTRFNRPVAIDAAARRRPGRPRPSPAISITCAHLPSGRFT
jgi:hypothetical protein